MKLVSKPGETERDFQARIQLAGRETRDAAVEKLRERYAPKLARLQEKGAESGRGRRQGTATSLAAEGADCRVVRRHDARRADGPTGRVALDPGPGNDRRARRGPICKRVSGRRASAQERLQEAQAEFAALEAELQREVAALEGTGSASVAIETIEIKPKRGGVEVRIVALAWKPVA